MRRLAVTALLCIAAVLLLALVMPGCSFLQPAADEAGRAIARICRETTHQVRLEAQARVNQAAAPHAVKITCEGDPTDP